MRRSYISVLSILCAATIAYGESRPVNLPFKDLQGKKVQLSDLRGKPVVVNFWATWCGPCRAEMPMLVEAEKSFASKGVVFVAVSLDDKETRPKVPAFVQEFAIHFPVWTNATTMDLQDLKLGEALPATAFLDAKGRIVARVLGQITSEELQERLRWLTDDAKGPAPEPVVRHVSAR